MVTLRRKLNLIQFTTEHRLTAGSRWRESCERHLTFKARFCEREPWPCARGGGGFSSNGKVNRDVEV
jgi:hypothetical protein